MMVRPLLSLPILATLAVTGCAYNTEPTGPTRNEERGMRMLEGKLAGEPQTCVQTERLNGSFVPDDRTILYRVNSTLLYRTDIDPPCPFLSDDRAIVTRTNVTQLCRGDQFQVVDPQSGTEYGLCNFGDFVPYRSR